MNTTEQETTHTAGAVRAAEIIRDSIGCKDNPLLSYTFTIIIDRETHAAEMEAALEFIAAGETSDGTNYNHDDALCFVNTAKETLEKVRG